MSAFCLGVFWSEQLRLRTRSEASEVRGGGARARAGTSASGPAMQILREEANTGGEMETRGGGGTGQRSVEWRKHSDPPPGAKH